MKTKAAQVTLTVICLLVGIMLVTQFRTQTKIQRSVLTESAANQATIVSNLYDGNVALRKEIEELTQQLDQYDRASDHVDLATMASELKRLRVASGLDEVGGPGIELRIEGALGPEDLQDLINELRNAGAEALAVNGQRIAAPSSVGGMHGALAVDGVALEMPYLLAGIGQPETLERALVRKGGVLAIIESAYPDARFAVEKKERLVLPAYQRGYRWTYAKPADK